MAIVSSTKARWVKEKNGNYFCIGEAFDENKVVLEAVSLSLTINTKEDLVTLHGGHEILIEIEKDVCRWARQLHEFKRAP